MRRKKWAGQEWAQRDLNIAIGFLMLLLLGARWRVFIVIAVVLAVGLVVVHVVRRRLRERRWEAESPEFWADKLK